MTAQRKKTGSGAVQQPAAATTDATNAAVAKPLKAAKKEKAGKAARPGNASAPKKKSSAKTKVKAAKKTANHKLASPPSTAAGKEEAQVLDSQVAFEGPLFRVMRDRIIEPGGRESKRDVIRHNGSVVILAVDPGKRKPGKRKQDPWIVVERQFRYAAGQFLWELPAGKLDAGEEPMEGAKRELAEETGYGAKKWSHLIDYFASPGFLAESMKVFLAEGLIPGDAHPEEDEQIDFRLVRLSELLSLIDKGGIKDGKTLTTILLYARKIGAKKKK